ncbi:glycophorin-C [Hemibagrus wyckioides]|nr:glycophorin-C [Hemibagrus wyckioides]XP_058247644.1 glycophorin-C [Hemibagrus wyckioides]XP_058247645.1 glycophorin-C [Hemibagrus wyckioides]
MLLRPDSMRMASNTTESGMQTLENVDSSYFNVIIGAVIAAVVLVFICLLLVLFRYMYRHKGTYHTNEAKGSEFAETADAALQGDPALQDAMDESKKEYFI